MAPGPTSARPDRPGCPGCWSSPDRHQAAAPLPDVVPAAVDGGTRAVELRDKDLPEPARCALARELAPIVHEMGGVLLTAGTLLPGADGVHEPAQAARLGATPTATTRAVERARAFVRRALIDAAQWRVGRGHGPIDHLGWSERKPGPTPEGR